MSVYDPEKTEDKSLTRAGSGSDEDLRSISGIHKDEENAMDREAHNGAAEDIAKREKLGYNGSTHKAGKDEANKLQDKTMRQANDEDSDEPSFFKDDDKSKKGRFRGKITAKRVAGGVAGVLGIGAIGGIMMTASGPLAFLHMANLMDDFHHESNENMQDGRLTRLWRWARGTDYRNNLTALGNHYADKIDARMRAVGIDPKYDGGGGRLARFEYDTENPKTKAYVDELIDKGYVPSDISGDGKIVSIDTTQFSKSQIRTLIDDQRIVLGEEAISNAMTHRMAKKRYAGGFHPLKNFYRKAGEKIIDYTRSVREYRDDYHKTGVDPGDRPRNPRTADQDADATKDNLNRNASDSIRADTPNGVKAKLIASIVTTTGLFGLYEIACNVDAVGGTIRDIRQLAIVEPLMRMGLTGLSMGSQISFGTDVNSDELGAEFTRFFGETDIGALSAFASDSIQAELGQEQIGERTATQGPLAGQKVKPADLSASSKPGTDEPAFFKTIDGLIDKIPAGAGEDACDFLLNSCIGTDDFSICPSDALDLGINFFTGDIAGVFASLTANGIFAGAGVIFSDWIDSAVNILAGAALQCLDGPQWGSCINFGNRLNANDNALSFGGRELDENEEVSLDFERKELEQFDLQSKSMYTRYLDPKETNSLFATAVFNNPNYFASAANLSKGLQAPLKNFGNIFSNFGNIFGGRTKAASVNYDYGFPEFGFSLDEQKDPAFENPYAIAQWVEEELPRNQQCEGGTKRLDCLNKKYSKCFKTKIDDTGKLTTEKAIDYKDIPGKCKSKTNTDLKKYRFYLVDTITLKSSACYEGADESACAELGFTDESKSGTGAGANGPLPDGAVTDADIEPVTGLTSGCHRNIAANANAMIAAAAADGVTLTGSCWRSNARQIQLRIINGCPDIYTASPSSCRVPTAIPGTSNHERGLAIDFDNCHSRGTACFIWLSANAATYGFYNLPSEPWHWSVNGN
jgi:hypothetical protein